MPTNACRQGARGVDGEQRNSGSSSEGGCSKQRYPKQRAVSAQMHGRKTGIVRAGAYLLPMRAGQLLDKHGKHHGSRDCVTPSDSV